MIKYCLNVRSDTNIYENEQGKYIFNQNGTDVMDDIQVASSENSSQSCIQLSYNAEQLFQVDELSQLSFSKNPNPSEQKLQTEDTPTYNQILSLTNAIIQKYPHLSITKIANYLYEKLIPVEKKYKTDHDPPKQQRKTYIQQCKYIARAYVELGYGVSKLRKRIAVEGINITISNAQYYEKLINRVFFYAYRKLQNLIKSECRGQTDLNQLKPLKSQFDMWALCQTLKNPGNCLSSQSCHTLDKLLKLTYVDYPIKMTRTQACNLYYSLHHFIEQRRKKGQMKLMQQTIRDDNTSISSIDLDDEFQCEDQGWNDTMEKILCTVYSRSAKNPDNLSLIQQQLKAQFPNATIFNQSFISDKLQETLRKIINLILEQLDQKIVLQQGNRFKRLVILNEQKIRQILVEDEAWSLRATLCDYYLTHCQSKDKAINLNFLSCAVLSINEFVNKKQHQQISKELIITKYNNRIDREEYAFDGKRRKVLVFKKNSKKYNSSHND